MSVNRLCAVLVLSGAGVLVAGCEEGATPFAYDSSQDWNVVAGEPAPDFFLVSLHGEKFRLSDLKGKVVVANFFATWCIPCRGELEEMEKDLWPLSQKDPRLEIVTIASNEPDYLVEKFVRSNPYEWPFLLDTDGAIFRTYSKTGSIPRIMVIDHEGKMALQKVGFSRDAMDALGKKVRELLGGMASPSADATMRDESST